MRKTLATTKSFVLSDKTRTLEEYLRVMKSVGLNEIDEEDCMFIGTSSILTLITQDSNLVCMIQQVKELIEHVEVLMSYLEEQFKPMYV